MRHVRLRGDGQEDDIRIYLVAMGSSRMRSWNAREEKRGEEEKK